MQRGKNQRRYDVVLFGKNVHHAYNHREREGAVELPVIQINLVSLNLRHSMNFPVFTGLPQILYYKAEIRHNPL